VVDNEGYTVERAIHGPDAEYNDIAAWDWTAAPAMFAPQRPSTATRVTTTEQLSHALTEAADSQQFTLIQAVVPQADVPELLSNLARAAASANAPAPTAPSHG
jgi:TPP-dependent 2-oxoacid decarboxylase